MRRHRLAQIKKHRLAQILILSLFLFTVHSALLTVNSFAEIPRTINYQGRLTDSTGKPLRDDKYKITFRLYETSGGGTAAWTEVHDPATGTGVDVERGIFNVLIGGTTTGGISLDFDKQYWLGIQVGSDTEMRPLQQLGSSAYAIRADVADEAIQAQNATTAQKAITIEGRTSDPASPTTGQMWLRTDL